MNETLVVKVSERQYDVFCIRAQCMELFSALDIGVYATRSKAEQAARAHRMADRKRQEAQDRRTAHCCRTCGQPVPVQA